MSRLGAGRGMGGDLRVCAHSGPGNSGFGNKRGGLWTASGTLAVIGQVNASF